MASRAAFSNTTVSTSSLMVRLYGVSSSRSSRREPPPSVPAVIRSAASSASTLARPRQAVVSSTGTSGWVSVLMAFGPRGSESAARRRPPSGLVG